MGFLDLKGQHRNTTRTNPEQVRRPHPWAGYRSANLASEQAAPGNQASRQFTQSCPLRLPGPGNCPYGGVCHNCPVQVRPKLKTGKRADGYAREVDRVVEQMASTPVAGAHQIQHHGRADRIHRIHGNQSFLQMLRSEDSPLVDVPAPIEAMCIDVTPNEGPTRCQFTTMQRIVINAIRRTARNVTSQAMLALGSQDRYVSMLARRIFHLAAVDMPSMTETVRQILGTLANTPLLCGTCADPTCNRGGVTAYTQDDLSSIIICPRFFLQNVTRMRRALIHEAGHAAAIDAAMVYTDLNPERYCRGNDVVECGNPCGLQASMNLLENVDAWAIFIECAAYSG